VRASALGYLDSGNNPDRLHLWPEKTTGQHGADAQTERTPALVVAIVGANQRVASVCPNGAMSFSPGLTRSSYPGLVVQNNSQPQRGCIGSCWSGGDTTLSGLMIQQHGAPSVGVLRLSGSDRQRWAECWNSVGVQGWCDRRRAARGCPGASHSGEAVRLGRRRMKISKYGRAAAHPIRTQHRCDVMFLCNLRSRRQPSRTSRSVRQALEVASATPCVCEFNEGSLQAFHL